MAAKEIAGTDFPVLLEKVVSVGSRIDLVRKMSDHKGFLPTFSGNPPG